MTLREDREHVTAARAAEAVVADAGLPAEYAVPVGYLLYKAVRKVLADARPGTGGPPNMRLIHEHARGMASGVVDVFANLLMPGDRNDAFHECFTVIEQGLVEYEEQAERMACRLYGPRRLEPSEN